MIIRGDVLHRVANLVYHAVLNLSVRIDAFDGLMEALQAVYTGDQDILDASVLQIGQNTQPVMGAFLIGEIQTQQLILEQVV